MRSQKRHVELRWGKAIAKLYLRDLPAWIEHHVHCNYVIHASIFIHDSVEQIFPDPGFSSKPDARVMRLEPKYLNDSWDIIIQKKLPVYSMQIRCNGDLGAECGLITGGPSHSKSQADGSKAEQVKCHAIWKFEVSADELETCLVYKSLSGRNLHTRHKPEIHTIDKMQGSNRLKDILSLSLLKLNQKPNNLISLQAQYKEVIPYWRLLTLKQAQALVKAFQMRMQLDPDMFVALEKLLLWYYIFLN